MTLQKEVAESIEDNVQELQKYAQDALYAENMTKLLDKIVDYIDTLDVMKEMWIENIRTIKKGYEFMLGQEQTYLQNRLRNKYRRRL